VRLFTFHRRFEENRKSLCIQRLEALLWLYVFEYRREV